MTTMHHIAEASHKIIYKKNRLIKNLKGDIQGSNQTKRLTCNSCCYTYCSSPALLGNLSIWHRNKIFGFRRRSTPANNDTKH